MRGVIYTLIGAIFWGISGTCGQYLLQVKHADPQIMTTLRLFAGGFIFLILARRSSRTAIFKKKASIIRLVAFGIFGMMMCQYAYTMAIQLTDAGTATVLQYVAPAMILVYVCMAVRRLPTVREVFSIFITICGTALIATHGDLTSFNINLEGFLWAMLAALGLAFYSLLPGKLQAENSTMVVAGWGMIFGGILMLIIARPWNRHMVFDTGTILGLIFMTVLGTVMAFAFYLLGLKMIGPIRASMICAVEPIAAACGAAFVLGTTFNFWDLVGFALVISVVFILAGGGKDASQHRRTWRRALGFRFLARVRRLGPGETEREAI